MKELTKVSERTKLVPLLSHAITVDLTPEKASEKICTLNKRCLKVVSLPKWYPKIDSGYDGFLSPQIKVTGEGLNWEISVDSEKSEVQCLFPGVKLTPLSYVLSVELAPICDEKTSVRALVKLGRISRVLVLKFAASFIQGILGASLMFSGGFVMALCGGTMLAASLLFAWLSLPYIYLATQNKLEMIHCLRREIASYESYQGGNETYRLESRGSGQ